jgi:hypothetical protein
MKPPKILALCQPMAAGVHFATRASLVGFYTMEPPAGWGPVLDAGGRGQPVHLNRELIAAQALGVEVPDGEARLPEPDILLWLDSDVSVEDPADLWHLVTSLDRAPEDVWLLGAPVRVQKADDPTPNWNVIFLADGALPNQGIAQNPYFANPEKPFIDVAAVGFGLVAIRAEAFRELERPWFDWKWDWKKAGPTIRKSYGEDVMFCDRIRAAGRRVVVDCSVRTSHWFETRNDIDPRQLVNRRGEGKWA